MSTETNQVSKETQAKNDKAMESIEVMKPKGAFYFKSPRFAGLTLQVQKMVKNPQTGKEEQEVDEQATFTQYYDTWKGDVIRVGYLMTESAKIAKLAESDDNVETITEKEYNEAVEKLRRAPVPAV